MPDPILIKTAHAFSAHSGDNPLLGRDRRITCQRISDVAQLMTHIFERGGDLEEVAPGLQLMAHAMWAAAQYSSQQFADDPK